MIVYVDKIQMLCPFCSYLNCPLILILNMVHAYFIGSSCSMVVQESSCQVKLDEGSYVPANGLCIGCLDKRVAISKCRGIQTCRNFLHDPVYEQTFS